jgi:hypothetical protein
LPQLPGGIVGRALAAPDIVRFHSAGMTRLGLPPGAYPQTAFGVYGPTLAPPNRSFQRGMTSRL